MNLIKLNAIDSTNDFLKDLIAQNEVENFTCVVAENQTKGKGQMGSVWEVEGFKNLTFSVLIKNSVVQIADIFGFNAMISFSIYQTLNEYNISDLKIKWPNDIMAGNKKIGGILIENIIKQERTIHSVVGVGLNVNQSNFTHLPKATSLLVISNKKLDLDLLLNRLLQNFETNFNHFSVQGADFFWKKYNQHLFKIHTPTAFQKNTGEKFMGIIEGVDFNGQLKVRLANNFLAQFNLKEIVMLY